jgi:hypothetical protein
MFHSGLDPMTGKRVYTATSDREKGLQKSLLLWHLPAERAKVMEALKELGREAEAGLLWGSGSGSGPGAPAHRRKHTTKKAR